MEFSAPSAFCLCFIETLYFDSAQYKLAQGNRNYFIRAIISSYFDLYDASSTILR